MYSNQKFVKIKLELRNFRDSISKFRKYIFDRKCINHQNQVKKKKKKQRFNSAVFFMSVYNIIELVNVMGAS